VEGWLEGYGVGWCSPMNLVDAYVVEILDQPHKLYGKWFLEVRYDSWGGLSDHSLMFNTKEEAENVVVGHHFLC
jgi:hypothetical protein